MVCAGQIAPVVPPSADRTRFGPEPRRAIRGSGLLSPEALRKALEKRAKALGFNAFGVCAAEAAPVASQRLKAWLEAGYHGDMLWMDETQARRASPQALWPEVRTVIMLGVNYGTRDDAMALLEQPTKGLISLYARRRDYHEVIKGRLKELAGLIASSGGDVKVFVDTAPVLEKALAEAAGIGWQGKNTVLISKSYGAWLFLGAIYTSALLPSSPPGRDACGTCTRCLDICPTAAFPKAYVLDSRRCISYLTIEHKGLIPKEFREPIGNRIFGCDDCLAICPWNKFARESSDMKLSVREGLNGVPLRALLDLDDASFRSFFAGTPVKRTGRDRFIRNVLIAIGNSGNATTADRVEALLGDPSAEVRGTAIWALAKLRGNAYVRVLAAAHLPGEADPVVRAEWAALNDSEVA